MISVGLTVAMIIQSSAVAVPYLATQFNKTDNKAERSFSLKARILRCVRSIYTNTGHYVDRYAHSTLAQSFLRTGSRSQLESDKGKMALIHERGSVQQRLVKLLRQVKRRCWLDGESRDKLFSVN